MDLKWEALFEENAKEWIAFKPMLGMHVYPCYSCRHMFFSKKSFLDHVNRRAVLLKYKCNDCNNENLIFYNRCSFLLHCRKHYSLYKGSLNLNNLEVSSLPLDLAGFFRHPDIPYLFDVEEEFIEGNVFMNSQFYSPKTEDKGKHLISLSPSNLVINRTNPNGENQSLSLKQIARNIPKCQFISMEDLKELRALMNSTNEALEDSVAIKNEPEEPHTERITFSEEPVTPPAASEPHNAVSSSVNSSEHQNSAVEEEVHNLQLPVITKVETVEDEPLTNSEPSSHNASNRESTQAVNLHPLSSLFNKCTECNKQIPESLSSSHFLGGNRPIDETLRCTTCKLICPTMCSFKAHSRIHAKRPPYVCPDCGEEYDTFEILISHMSEVCYHMAKSVRYRCPGRRCGKIFASDATFGPHFKQAHIDTVYMCGHCKEIFPALEDCEDHCLTHKEEGANILKLFSCPSCMEDDMNWHQLKKHVDFHCKDLSRCIYIYMCKFCRCYFRSVQTMATHIQNCKVQKQGVPKRMRTTYTNNFSQSKYISGECKICCTKIICLRTNPTIYCSKCHPSNVKPPVATVKSPAPDKCVCILCKSQIEYNERRKHQQECKYAKPQVLVERLDLEKALDTTNEMNPSSNSNSSNSDLDGSNEGSPQKRSGDFSDENRSKKRHRPSKPKKIEVENDLTAEEPIAFDGTYQCRVCEYKNTDRQMFHEHIKSHRHISTAYQCMECAECFVVKPSLVKHLLHFHNIADSEQYFSENDCFDKSAVHELAKVVKAPYLANDVKENQCKVCMEQFDNAEDHDKHFRTHGMAFLMKNSI